MQASSSSSSAASTSNLHRPQPLPTDSPPPIDNSQYKGEGLKNQDQDSDSDSDCSTCSECDSNCSSHREASPPPSSSRPQPLRILSLTSLPNYNRSVSPSQLSLLSHPPNLSRSRHNSISPSNLINSTNLSFSDYDLGPPPFPSNQQQQRRVSYPSVQPQGSNHLFYYSQFPSLQAQDSIEDLESDQEEQEEEVDMSSFSLSSAASGGIVSILENSSAGPSSVRRASVVNNGSGKSTPKDEGGRQLRSRWGEESNGSVSTPNGEDSNGGTGSDFFGSGSGETGRSSSAATSMDESGGSGSGGNGPQEAGKRSSPNGQQINPNHHQHPNPQHTQLEPGAMLPRDQPRTRQQANDYAHGHLNPVGLEGQQLLQDDRKFVSSPLPQEEGPSNSHRGTSTRSQGLQQHERVNHEDPNRRIVKRRDSSPVEDYQFEGGWQSDKQGHAPAYSNDLHQPQVKASPTSTASPRKGKGSTKSAAEPPVPTPKRREEIVPISRSNSSKGRPLDTDALESQEGPSQKRAKPQILPDGKKRYPCQHPGCDKTFSTSGHAARHNRIHTGE